jgi:hypothetical protein
VTPAALRWFFAAYYFRRQLHRMRIGDSLRMMLAGCRIWLFYQPLFSGSAVTVAGATGRLVTGHVARKDE